MTPTPKEWWKTIAVFIISLVLILVGLQLIGCATTGYAEAGLGRTVTSNLPGKVPAHIELGIRHKDTCLGLMVRHDSNLDEGSPFYDTWDYEVNRVAVTCEVTLWGGHD